MAITMNERFKSPARMSQASNYRKDKFSQNYILNGDAGETENDIYAYLTANTPTVKDSLIRDRIDVNREDSPDWWDAVVYYTHPQSSSTTKTPEPGQSPRITVRSAGGTTINRIASFEFIEESVAEKFSEKWALDATGTIKDNVKKLIGWKTNPDGTQELEGIDVTTGGVEIAVQIAVTAAQISGGYLVNTATHAANQAVNLNPWQGFAAKTLRFISFQATPRNDDNPAWDITYTFDFKPAIQISIEVSDTETLNITQQGQHLLDYITENETIEPGNVSFQLPKICRLATHRMYPEIDYATELLI